MAVKIKLKRHVDVGEKRYYAGEDFVGREVAEAIVTHARRESDVSFPDGAPEAKPAADKAMVGAKTSPTSADKVNQ